MYITRIRQAIEINPISRAITPFKPVLLIFFVVRIATIAINVILAGNGVKSSWGNWDALHYIEIAKTGFRFAENATASGNTLAFFPLYPVSISIISALGIDTEIAALLLSNLYSLSFICILYLYVRKQAGEKAGLMAALLALIHPAGIFLTTPHSESLFLLLVMGTFYFIQEKYITSAGMLAGLAALTRITGGILGFVILYYAYEELRRTRDLRKFIYSLSYTGMPFVLYMLYQHYQYGTPDAFLKAQTYGWQLGFNAPWNTLLHLIEGSSGMVRYRIDLFILTFTCFTLWISRKSVEKELLFFSWALIIISLCTSQPWSLQRFLLSVIPLYVYWGTYLSTRTEYTRLTVIVALTVVFSANAVSYLTYGRFF